MSSFTIRPNNQTEQILDELLEEYGGSKVSVVDLLAEKYLQTKQENARLSDELDESKKMQKGMLREMEEKLDVLYELENTNQVWQVYSEFHSTSETKSPIVKAAESYVDLKRKERIFHQLEKRVVD
ncbi:hypothetical protein [Enterococcus hulanensis]|uniref:hypothetical protein n=1 Tax=Enterococcus hulanensis TaxID=2559929 RepID=UPI0010F89D29|nr:hypothetical protein [Enterococcus hulanensis]